MDVLAEVAPRLKAARLQHGATLRAVSEATGISVSTLSRLESGQRRPSLELLLPLARTYGVALDDLVGAPETGDPRVRLKPVKRGRMTMVPLTRRPGGVQAFKVVLPRVAGEPALQTHEGYEWLYVLDGRLRLLLGAQDLELGPGEAAEFDTRVPHAFVAAGRRAVELLVLFGPQGERVHLRARPAGRTAG
jgi:quercetin dioxygenase-like cupin family protein/DNA-binding XRE family transcriptional regulator